MLQSFATFVEHDCCQQAADLQGAFGLAIHDVVGTHRQSCAVSTLHVTA